MTSEVRAVEADIPFGMTQIEDGDAQVLFIRDETGLRAFQASCPHAGAPLADGKICGRTLYCPWHKAAFDIGDGSLEQPPAFVGLDQYPIRTEGEKVVATLEPMAKAKPSPRTHDDRTFVIVGTGAVASAAVVTLRDEGFGGRILMVAREAGEPYDRTMLSKDFLLGGMKPSEVALAPKFLESHDVELVKGPATRIEPTARSVFLSDRRSIVGDALLIATGSKAVKPGIAGQDLKKVFTLRSLSDAVALQEAIETAKSIAIVGGGFIALEAAAFLAQRGLAATIIAPEALPLASRLGDDIGHAIKVHHEGTGVRFVAGQVARFEGSEAVQSVRVKGGQTIETDLVLVAAGAQPDTSAIDWRKNTDGSVDVDEHLTVAPGVWLAGDIADFPLYDGRRARIEHWRLAEQHGRHAARGMMGIRAAFAAAPFFWSRQGELSLAYAGYAHEWDEIVTHGEPAKLDFIAYYVRGGNALAACAVGHDAALTEFLHELGANRRVPAAGLLSRH